MYAATTRCTCTRDVVVGWSSVFLPFFRMAAQCGALLSKFAHRITTPHSWALVLLLFIHFKCSDRWRGSEGKIEILTAILFGRTNAETWVSQERALIYLTSEFARSGNLIRFHAFSEKRKQGVLLASVVSRLFFGASPLAFPAPKPPCLPENTRMMSRQRSFSPRVPFACPALPRAELRMKM